MSRPRTQPALALLLSALVGAAGAQPPQKQSEASSIQRCDEGCQLKRLADAAAALRNASCSVGSCGPSPPYVDKRGQFVLPPAEMEKVILGMALLARSQGLQPQQLAAKLAQVKLP